jgi:hypothetical protein
MMIDGRRKMKDAFLDAVLEIPSALFAPNTVTSIVTARRRACQIPNAEADLSSSVCIDSVLIDVPILISQPERGLGHRTLTFTRRECIETVK